MNFHGQLPNGQAVKSVESSGQPWPGLGGFTFTRANLVGRIGRELRLGRTQPGGMVHVAFASLPGRPQEVRERNQPVPQIPNLFHP
jgi:hypothetical protein